MTGPADGPSWQDVLDLVTRLDASGLADAEVVSAGVSVRVSRTTLDGPARPAPPPPPPVAVAAVAPQQVPAASGPAITAPMLGVLYHRPAPDASPFVQVGDTVTPETTVAIIEVMKLMNPVPAGVHGVVAQICVADGNPVEHGDVLFRLEG